MAKLITASRVIRWTRFSRSAPQSIPNNLNTAVIWQTILEDFYGFFNPATPTRIIIPDTRKYWISMLCGFATSGAGANAMELFRNGSRVTHTIWGVVAVASSEWPMAFIGNFNAGDFLEMIVSQTSGGPLDLNAQETFLSIRRAT